MKAFSLRKSMFGRLVLIVDDGGKTRDATVTDIGDPGRWFCVVEAEELRSLHARVAAAKRRADAAKLGRERRGVLVRAMILEDATT